MSTIVNFAGEYTGTEFVLANPAGILPYLRATEGIKRDKPSGLYQFRNCFFSAGVVEDTRFLPSYGLVSSVFLVDQLRAAPDDARLLLQRLQSAARQYHCVLLFTPLSKAQEPSKARPDSELLEVGRELFVEQLKRNEVESKLNRSVPFFAYRSATCPTFQQFEGLVEGVAE
jgi:hypothetical protein